MCDCLDNISKKISNEFPGMIIATSFSFGGGSYPYLYADNENSRKKGGKKITKIIIPTYCPFCGLRY